MSTAIPIIPAAKISIPKRKPEASDDVPMRVPSTETPMTAPI